MERLVLTFLLGVTLSSAADATISPTRRIVGGDSISFPLPEGKTVVLAIKSAEDLRINYKYYAKGRLVANDDCDECYKGSLWVPFLTITEEWIKRYDSEANPFQENIESSAARNLSVESKSPSPVELQVFPLPLKGHEVVEIPFGRSVNLSLPEKEEVWLALWNDEETPTSVTFNLYNETELIGVTFPAIVKKGWYIIRIYVNKIVYEPNLHHLSNDRLNGRRLELYSDNYLKSQVFSMPLEPTGAKEKTDTNESADTNVTLILIVFVVSLVVLLLLGAACLGYRFCWKKRQEGLRGGSPRVTADNEYSRTVGGDGGLARQNSSHDSENNLYGARIVTHSDLARQNSAHDSENSLYGARIVTHGDVTRQNSAHDSENSVYGVTLK